MYVQTEQSATWSDNIEPALIPATDTHNIEIDRKCAHSHT